MQQLELDLWGELQDAADVPELADLRRLWLSLDTALAVLPTQEQLQVAGDAITQVAQILAQRWLLNLEEIDSALQDQGPVVPPSFFERFVRRSMHVDLAQFVEPPPPLPRSSSPRRQQRFANHGSSIVAVIDKAALLEVLEPELDDESAKAEALAVAHREDISAWVEAISHYLDSKQAESVSLVELAEQVKYPVIRGEKKGSALVKTWLALILGGFTLSQCSDFYNCRGIQVQQQNTQKGDT